MKQKIHENVHSFPLLQTNWKKKNKKITWREKKETIIKTTNISTVEQK